MTVIDMSNSRCDFAIKCDDVKNCDVRRVSPPHFDLKQEGSNLDSGVFCDERFSYRLPLSPAPNLFTDVGCPGVTPSNPQELSAPSASRLGRASPREHDVPSWSVFNLQNEEGDTCLHVAIVLEVTTSILTLIRTVPHKSFLNIKNGDGHTPLHVAVLTGQPHVIRWLLVEGAEASKQDRRGNTALHLACSSGDIHCVQAFMSHFLQEGRDDTSSGLHLKHNSPTCRRKSRITSKELAESSERTRSVMPRSKPHVSNTRSEISLERFSRKPTVPVSSLRQLFEIRNFAGEMSVHVATAHGDVNVLRMLFRCGADTCSKEGKSGNTVLHMAIERGIDCISRYVIDECVDSVQRLFDARNYAGMTAYELAMVIDSGLAVKLRDKRAVIHEGETQSEKKMKM